jgi:hypothetical protein
VENQVRTAQSADGFLAQQSVRVRNQPDDFSLVRQFSSSRTLTEAFVFNLKVKYSKAGAASSK